MALIDVALIVELFKNLLYLLFMVLIRRADEFVVGRVHQIPDALDFPGHAVHELLRRHTGGGSLLFDFLSMLIGSRLEIYVIALLPLVAGNGVGQNNFISISDMRLAGCIGNGRGNVVRFFTVFTHNFSSCLVPGGISLTNKKPAFIFKDESFPVLPL